MNNCICQGVYQKEIGERRKMVLGMQSHYKAFVDAATKSQVLKNQNHINLAIIFIAITLINNSDSPS